MQGFLSNKPAVLYPPAEIFPLRALPGTKPQFNLAHLVKSSDLLILIQEKKKTTTTTTFKGRAAWEEEQSCVFSEEQLLDRFSQSVPTVSLELPVWTSQALPQGEA